MEREIVGASLAAGTTRGLVIFFLPALEFRMKQTQGQIVKAAGVTVFWWTGQISDESL